MEKEEFEVVGWAKLSNSRKALIITLDEKRVGVIGLKGLGKTLNGENKASPIVLPVEKTTESVQKIKVDYPELKKPATEK